MRFSVWRRRTRLDRELADGVSPAHDPALSLRAHQLLRHKTRSAIAATIRNLLDAAEEPPEAWGRRGPRPPLQSDAVLAARAELLALAEVLCQPQAVSPQAVALAMRLVWDSASPMYSTDPDTPIAQWVGSIIDILDRRS